MSSDITRNNGMKVHQLEGALWVSIAGHQTNARTRCSKEINVVALGSYFLRRQFGEEEKPIREYGKRMHNIWKERQGS